MDALSDHEIPTMTRRREGVNHAVLHMCSIWVSQVYYVALWQLLRIKLVTFNKCKVTTFHPGRPCILFLASNLSAKYFDLFYVHVASLSFVIYNPT
jgi:hypothetical protein